MSSNLRFIVGASCFLLLASANRSRAEDFIGPAGTPAVTPASTPISIPSGKNTLNALMKHPRAPNFDRLRPMSGEWVRCLSLPPPAAGSRQDHFSSSDSSHFTRLTTTYSDRKCLTRSKETRTSWICEPSTKELLSCKLLKEELAGESGWSELKKSDDELAGSTIKISLKSLGKKVASRKLEVRWRPDASDDPSETETILLNYRAAPAKTGQPAKN